jgi:hypothetical protein
VPAWLGAESRETWARFDETGKPEDEPYHITGKMTGLDRDKGKTCTQAFGYMGGVVAYRVLAKTIRRATRRSSAANRLGAPRIRRR